MATPKQSNEEKFDLAARLTHQPPAASQSSEPGELMRLLRHPQSGRLIVEIAGQRYEKLADIANKEIGRYILQVAAHLLAFTNGMIATEAGLKSTYNPKVKKTPWPIAPPTPISQLPDPLAASSTPAPAQAEPSPDEPVIPRPSPEAEAAFQASLRHARPAPPKPPPQRGGLFGRSKKPAEAPILPGLNLAEEIDKIVQSRLMNSPLAGTTQLGIIADPGGGIQIDVNGRLYSSPDDIPDPEVKELIKASIKQWERS